MCHKHNNILGHGTWHGKEFIFFQSKKDSKSQKRWLGWMKFLAEPGSVLKEERGKREWKASYCVCFCLYSRAVAAHVPVFQGRCLGAGDPWAPAEEDKWKKWMDTQNKGWPFLQPGRKHDKADQLTNLAQEDKIPQFLAKRNYWWHLPFLPAHTTSESIPHCHNASVGKYWGRGSHAMPRDKLHPVTERSVGLQELI